MRIMSGIKRLGATAVAVAALVAFSAPVAGAAGGAEPGRRVTWETHYDRNASVVQDGATTWMFFARSQAAPCNRLAACDADNTDYDLYAKRSGNQGKSWGNATRVALNPGPTGTTPFRGRTISATVDGSGRTWLFWASGGNSGPLYYTHNDRRGSNHWAPLQSLNDAAYFNVNAVTKGATTYVYYEDAGSTAPGIYVRTFDGTTFTAPQLVAAGMSIPKVIVDRYGIFRMAMVDASGPTVNVDISSSQDGLTWSSPQVVVAGDGTVTNWDPALVQTGDGIYHLFWAPDLGNGTQRIETETSHTLFDWSASTVVTSPSGYWDYWPVPTAIRGLSLFYTSEAGGTPGTGHIYQLTTPVPAHH